MHLLCVVDRQVQLERGDPAAQELVNSLQVLEVMAGAMAAELRPLVRLRCVHVKVFILIVFPVASEPVNYCGLPYCYLVKDQLIPVSSFFL